MIGCLLLAGCVSQPVAPPATPAPVKRTVTIPAALMPPPVAPSPKRMTTAIIVPPPPARTNLLLTWDYGTNHSWMSQIFAAADLSLPFNLLCGVVGTNFSTMVSNAPSMFFQVAPIAAVALAWTPSPSTNVTNYKIYWGVASGIYGNQFEIGNVTNAIVPSLAYGTTYYFAATALDALGVESAFSNETTWATPTNAPAPQNLNLTLW